MSNFINKDISKMDYQDGRDHKLAKMAYVESELGLTMPDLTDNEITVLAEMYKGAGDPTDKMKYFDGYVDESINACLELRDINKLLNWNDHQVAGLVSSLESKGLAYSSYVDDYDVRGKYVRGIRSYFDLSHRGCHIIAKLFANIEVSDSKSTCDLFHSC